MSSFQHHGEHIAAAVGSAVHYSRNTFSVENALSLAKQLADANVAGQLSCYNEVVEPVVVTEEMIQAWVESPLTPASFQQCVGSIDYQCCEWRAWGESEACKIMHGLVPVNLNPSEATPTPGSWGITMGPDMFGALALTHALLSGLLCMGVSLTGIFSG